MVLTAHSQRGESSQSLCYAGQMENPPLPCHHQHGSIQRTPQAQTYRVAQARHKLAVLCGTVGEVGCPAEPPLALPIADAEPKQHPRLPSDSSSTLSGLAPRSERARYQRPFSPIERTKLTLVQPGISASECVMYSQSPLTPLCRRAPAGPMATERWQLRSAV